MKNGRQIDRRSEEVMGDGMDSRDYGELDNIIDNRPNTEENRDKLRNQGSIDDIKEDKNRPKGECMDKEGNANGIKQKC